ncbi:MAG: AMP-binding protein [Lachnospiraceae bacterium]|nr:AMP-binding protein [Lachnospiraceae bacterium]
MDAAKTKTIRDLVKNAAAEYGNRVFLRFEDNDNIYDVKYSDFEKDCEAVAAWASAKERKAGHPLHIGFFGISSKEYLTALFGVLMSGNVAVPLDVQIGVDTMNDNMTRAAVDVLFYDWEYKERAELMIGTCSSLGEIYSLNSGRNAASLKDILTEYNGKNFDEDFSTNRCAMILYTSGTTGRSKGVMLSQGNLIDNCFASDLPGRQDSEVYLSVLPIHHVFCFDDDMLMGMRYGSTICLNQDLKKMVDHLQLFKPTSMRLVPMMAKALMNRMKLLEMRAPDREKKDIAAEVLGENMHRITSGGGYLSPELAEDFRRFGIEIGQGYGMSECSPKIAVPDWDRPEKVASLGRPVKGCQVKIEDGEIIVKSPSVMMGYYKEPENTAETLDAEGWLHTGDLGYIDEDGFIFMTGRKKNLIILSNGENVSPEQIEKYFDEEELVADIIVFDSDDRIAAEIYPNFAYADAKGINDIETAINNIVRNVNEELPSYQKIVRVKIRKKPFEKTSSRKIIRSKFFTNREKDKETRKEMELPETDIQHKIYDLAVAAIGHSTFGIHMDLYDVGMDSMGSVMFLSELYKELKFSVTLEELMANPTVELLEKLYWEKNSADKVDYTKRDVYPLTSLQMYFAYVMRGNTTANLPFLFKLSPNVDLRRLKKAVEAVFEVHPELKDIIQPSEDGKGLLNYRNDDRHIEIPIMIISNRGWEDEKKKLLRPYTYAKGENLFHVCIYSTDSANYLFFDIAHIIGDGMTMNILFDDLNRLYKGEELKRESYTYYEYILDSIEREKKGLKAKDQEYFEKLLKGKKIDRNILVRRDYHDLDKGQSSRCEGMFDELNRNELVGFCKKYGVSENVVFLTAFNYAISIFMDESDTVSTSIHSGRTDSRWNRLSGPLFLTYFFRYTNIPHETVPKLLKRMAGQIMETMRCHMSTLHADDMFFQYQGDILNIDNIGDEPAERQRIILSSLPFHMMVYAENKGYRYEVRYWENRFDRTLIEIFVRVMNYVIIAMYTEPSVRRLKKHLPQDLIPKHFYIEAGRLNEAAGEEIISDVGEKELVKPYIFDDRYQKKPYGAWGELYILNHEVKNCKGAVEYPYGGGLLYNTGRIARITPDGYVDFLENVGRCVLHETVTGRSFPELKKIENTIKDFPSVVTESAYVVYSADDNKLHVTAELTSTNEINAEDLDKYMVEQLGQGNTPVDYIINGEFFTVTKEGTGN